MKTLTMILLGISANLAIANVTVNLRPSIEAQAMSVFTAADSKVTTDQLVCFEFGKLIGLGVAYKAVQPGAPLENYINETVSLYSRNCNGKRLAKRERAEIGQLAQSIFTEINN